MSHLYRMTEWESPLGWHCGDVEDLGHGSNYWWLPAKMMGLTPAQYLKYVIDNYKPDSIRHSENFSYVGWSWKDQSAMRKFKNSMNALARKKNFMVC